MIIYEVWQLSPFQRQVEGTLYSTFSLLKNKIEGIGLIPHFVLLSIVFVKW